MKPSKPVILVALVSLVTGGAYFWLSGPTTDLASACRPETIGLQPEAPAELVAMFDKSCAAALVASLPNGASLAFDLGYPSLAFGQSSKAEVMAALDAIAAEGDRGFFTNDSGVLGIVPPGPTHDFIQTTLDPAAAIPKAYNPLSAILALPLWGAEANNDVLAGACLTHDCSADQTKCPTSVGLSDKLRVATGSISLADFQRTCVVSFEWITALRRAGLVDTTCTSSLQINRAMTSPETLNAPCFGADFDFSSLPVISSGDIPRLIRSRGVAGLDQLGPGNVAAMQDAFPQTAAFLSSIARP